MSPTSPRHPPIGIPTSQLAATEAAPTTTAPILVIMGVSGCGKSTVARILHRRLGWDYAEGDDLHPAANIAKMATGVPLTDADRLPWLRRIADWIDAHTAANAPGLVTASVLKRAYRDVLRRPGIVFIHVTGSRGAIEAQLRARKGHFMPPALLESQLAILEAPNSHERHLTILLPATPEDIADTIVATLDLKHLNEVRPTDR